MLKKIDVETKVGGICAIIAIIAGIIEIAFNNFTSAAIAGGVKDIFSTLVAVLVLVVAVRKLRPKKENLSFEQTIEKELNEIQMRYDPLFVRGEKVGYPNVIRYELRTNISCLFSQGENTNGESGRFVDFEKTDHTKMLFYINKTTFGKKLSKEQWAEKAPAISDSFVGCIGRKFQGFCKAIKSSSGEEIIVTFIDKDLKTKVLETNEEAMKLVRLVEYIIMLYIAKYEKE